MLDNRLHTLASQLTKMTPQQRQQFAALHKDDPIMLGMAKFVNDQQQALSLALQGAQAGPALAQPPVVDQAIAQMAPPAAGLNALPAPNMEGAPDGGVAGYAEGGKVGYNDGGRAALNREFAYASKPDEKNQAIIYRTELRKAVAAFENARTPEEKARAEADIHAVTREMKRLGITPQDVTAAATTASPAVPVSYTAPAAPVAPAKPAAGAGLGAITDPLSGKSFDMPGGLMNALANTPQAPAAPAPADPGPWQVHNRSEVFGEAQNRVTNMLRPPNRTVSIGASKPLMAAGTFPRTEAKDPLTAMLRATPAPAAPAGIAALGSLPQSAEAETAGTSAAPQPSDKEIVAAAKKAAPEMKGKGLSGEDWLTLGLNLMASKSPYFLQALGESGIATLRSKEGREKLASEAQYREALGRDAIARADYTDYLKGPAAAAQTVSTRLKMWEEGMAGKMAGLDQEAYEQLRARQRRLIEREVYREMGLPPPSDTSSFRVVGVR